MEFHTICFPYRESNEQQDLHISYMSYGISYDLLFIPWLKRTTRFAYLTHFLWICIQFALHTVTETNNKVCISCQFPVRCYTICFPYNDWNEQHGLHILTISYGFFYILLFIQCGGHLRKANFCCKSSDLPPIMLTFHPRSLQISPGQVENMHFH